MIVRHSGRSAFNVFRIPALFLLHLPLQNLSVRYSGPSAFRMFGIQPLFSAFRPFGIPPPTRWPRSTAFHSRSRNADHACKAWELFQIIVSHFIFWTEVMLSSCVVYLIPVVLWFPTRTRNGLKSRFTFCYCLFLNLRMYLWFFFPCCSVLDANKDTIKPTCFDSPIDSGIHCI